MCKDSLAVSIQNDLVKSFWTGVISINLIPWTESTLEFFQIHFIS